MFVRRYLGAFLVVGLVLVESHLLGRADQTGAAAFEVDTSKSRIFVKVGKATRLGHEHGIQGNLKSGQIHFAGRGKLVFDMASFEADTAEARRVVGLGNKKVSSSEAKKVTDAMRGAEVLDTARFPTATFTITSIVPLDKQTAGAAGRYRVAGSFKLRDVEKKLDFQAEVEAADKAGALRMHGTFALKQTDHGITPYSAAGGLVKVADELQISGRLVLTPGK